MVVAVLSIEHRYVTITMGGKVRVTFRGSGKRYEMELTPKQADTLMGELYDALDLMQRADARMIETDSVLRHLRELS